MKIYLDACCYNRPFDLQSSDRIIIEANSILMILKKIQNGNLILVSSEVLDFELEENPDIEKRKSTLQFLELAKYHIHLSNKVIKLALKLENLGFKHYDALHLAIAENEKLDYFLTTDDKLITLAVKNLQYINVKVVNPIRFIEGFV